MPVFLTTFPSQGVQIDLNSFQICDGPYAGDELCSGHNVLLLKIHAGEHRDYSL